MGVGGSDLAGAGGFGGGARCVEAGSGDCLATWQVGQLAAGTYDVQVTWVAGADRASDAAYRIYDGDTLLATVRVDQRQGPAGAEVGGVAFQSLGQFAVSSGRLWVVLSDEADGLVVADALRVVAG